MNCGYDSEDYIDVPLADDATEVGQRAAYDKFMAIATALPADEVVPTRFDVNLAFDNIQIGLRSLEAVRDKFLAMPGVQADTLDQIRGLSLALLFANRKIAQTTDEKIAADVDLKEMRYLRILMLDGYRNAARAGLVPKAPLDNILEGRTSEDASADCIDLAALYRTHWEALANKTPVTQGDVNKAEKIAQRVRDLLALEGGVFGKSSGDVRKAADLRNRFGVLLVRAHDIALGAAPFLFGKSWKDFVPTRQSRRALSLRKKKAEPKPVEPATSMS